MNPKLSLVFFYRKDDSNHQKRLFENLFKKTAEQTCRKCHGRNSHLAVHFFVDPTPIGGCADEVQTLTEVGSWKWEMNVDGIEKKGKYGWHL